MRNVWLDISSFIVAPKLLIIVFTIMNECAHAHTNTHIQINSWMNLMNWTQLLDPQKNVSSIPVFSPQTYPKEMDLK